MSKQLMSVDELRDALKAAEEQAEATDAALQMIDAETPEEQVNDLREEYEIQTGEIGRLAEALGRKEKMAAALAAVPRQSDTPDEKPTQFGGLFRNEPLTYRRNGPTSFFKDILYASKEGDPSAAARLARHTNEMKTIAKSDEQYAVAVANVGGFVPPQYLTEEWAQFARAGRPLANALTSRPLPAAGTSFNIPKVTTGSTAAVQAAEADAVADNSPAGTDVALAISTIAAKVDMSRQAFDRSEPGLDEVLGQDLAGAYAQQVDSEIINGPGPAGGRVEGILASDGINAVTFTTPVTVAGLYPKIADAIQQVDTGRFMAPNLIVMHPRRWAWFLAALDTQSRPLVTPYAPMNPMGAPNAPVAEGFVGNLQGLDVLKDANIPTLLGASTTEDRVIVTRREDLYLFESGTPVIRVYEEVLSGTLQVRIQAFGYIAFTAERYPKATSVISGAGLVAPTF
jgi:HK97 family phage major capsid protein